MHWDVNELYQILNKYSVNPMTAKLPVIITTLQICTEQSRRTLSETLLVQEGRESDGHWDVNEFYKIPNDHKTNSNCFANLQAFY